MKLAVLLACLAVFTNTFSQTNTMQDSSFGAKQNGTVIFPNPSNADPAAWYTALQSTGKIVTAVKTGCGYADYCSTLHDSVLVYRYNVNGFPENSFGTNGVAKIPVPVKHIVGRIYGFGCQPDDKIVGLYTYDSVAYGAPEFTNLFRLTKNGAMDSSFGKKGLLKVSQTPWFGKAMKVLPGGEIITSEFKIETPDYKITALCINHYNSDGTFMRGDTVKLKQPLLFNREYPRAQLEYDAQGRTILLFSVFLPPITQNIVVARITPQGTLDPTFNNCQVFILHELRVKFYGLNFAAVCAVQPDNKILLGIQQYTKDFTVIRLKANGTYDVNFGDSGTATMPFPNYGSADIHRLAVQPDGKILALGNTGISSGESDVYTLGRFLSNGKPDSSFGNNGSTVTIFLDVRSNFSQGNDMVIQPDGKIVTVGFTRIPGGIYASMVRYVPVSNAAIAQNFSEKNAADISTKKLTTSSVSISPNPVKDILNITSTNLSYKNISIIDVSGKVMLKDGFAGSNHSINISGLNAGVYYLQLFSNNTLLQTIKFIKQ